MLMTANIEPDCERLKIFKVIADDRRKQNEQSLSYNF